MRPFEPRDFQGAVCINAEHSGLELDGAWDYLHGGNSITHSGIYLVSQAYRIQVEDAPDADTQNYAERFPASYTAQTEWIVAQREARRIAGVFHLGDITNRNTPEQWKNAQAAMRVLHAYVYYDDTRYDWATHGTRQKWNPHAYGMAKASQGDVHDGEQLWQELVSKHRNVIMTFNGHVLDDGLGRVTTAAAGREISQQLFNFQMRPNGGDGWLRLVEMRPDGTAHTWDYSPVLGSRNESPKNQFAFTVAKVG